MQLRSFRQYLVSEKVLDGKDLPPALEALFSENVKPGLYLLVQTQACPGFQKLKPILVSVPMYNPEKDSYDYQVDATVKPAVKRETEPSPTPTPTASPSPTPKPGPKLPQTGQLNWPVPVLACGGVIFLLLGLWLLGSDRRRSQP